MKDNCFIARAISLALIFPLFKVGALRHFVTVRKLRNADGIPATNPLGNRLMPAASLQVTGPTFNPLLFDRQAGTLENDGALVLQVGMRGHQQNSGSATEGARLFGEE